MDRLRPLGFNSREDIRTYIIDYLKGFYPDWSEEKVRYKNGLTQCERVLHYMEDFGTINPMQAIQDLGCYRLGPVSGTCVMLDILSPAVWYQEKQVWR